ncbi:Helix-turn-helix domain-containing protein [Candidatus Magnetomoraceae bacterium gMMP-15]
MLQFRRLYMLELMKKQTTKELAEIHIRNIPVQKIDSIHEIIEKIFDLANLTLNNIEKEYEKTYSIDEIFSHFHIGNAVRGFRTREQLTQKDLAKKIQVTPKYISEIENGKRQLSEDIAKKLAKALNTDYKVLISRSTNSL